LDDIPILGRNDASHLVKQCLAHYDAPAFIRRARRVQETFDHLLRRCRQQRDEWLQPVVLWLRTLGALLSDWDALGPLLKSEDQVHAFAELQATLGLTLRPRSESAVSLRTLRSALRSLHEGIERFNRRWQEYLHTVNLNEVNALRDGYNRYYLLEKECALRSARIARRGFRRLEPLTVEELARLLPLLPVPQVRD
jgi:hypothetical protein